MHPLASTSGDVDRLTTAGGCSLSHFLLTLRGLKKTFCKLRSINQMTPERFGTAAGSLFRGRLELDSNGTVLSVEACGMV